MADRPSISVAVATFKRPALLRQTLDALAGDARSWGATVQAIVVCDGEDEGTRQLAQTYTAAGLDLEWVFHKQNLGLASARNSGAERAGCDFLLFLDDDSEVAQGFLSEHVNVHLAAEEQDPRYRYVACGRIVESAPTKQASPTGEFLERAWSSALDRYEAAMRIGETDPDLANAMDISCFGLNCSMRHELFAATGGFQGLLRSMSQDLEYGARLFMKGVRFLSTPATVFHRNDKNLVAYFTRCWSFGGTYDILRAVQLRQHNAQTRNLLNLDTGPKLGQLTNRVFWHSHEQSLRLAALLRHLTDKTRSRLAFRLWHDAERLSHYWAAVQEAGITREQLKDLAGEPKRVLMLHSICKPQNARESRHYLSPGRFRLLLERMRDGGYLCADPKKLEDPDAVWLPRELVLTFDDGYDDFYTEVFPLIAEHGLKPLVFLPTDWIGRSNGWEAYKPRRKRNLMTLDQIRELQRHGVLFGSHSLTHPSLPTLNPDELWREVSESKHRLEDLLGKPINTFAYPFGEANRRVRAAVIEAGYKLAFTITEGLNIWQDPFALKRIDINDRVATWSYSLKLRTGLSARESLKQEFLPLLRIIPREIRAPLVKTWRSRRPIQF
ncbi:MAG TPA: polysaccharide deacetylase family protein [Terracidiphilus sp.]|jgi:peptidoglycan/xylan/chitin deacetylase (PgdA/CDA1 family)/GT2 family glycosyltransferase